MYRNADMYRNVRPYTSPRLRMYIFGGMFHCFRDILLVLQFGIHCI